MDDHDDENIGEERSRISPELTRELVLSSLAAASSSEKSAVAAAAKNKPLKLTHEAVLATAELLRLFVVEARGRAAVEAECEAEGAGTGTAVGRLKSDASNDDDDDIAKGAGTGKVLIGAHHITKLAAELLLEFS